MAGTYFSDIYNCFLGKITDDMYMELTPQDTMRDLQNLLFDAIPGFEFPRCDLSGYTISTSYIDKSEVEDGMFVLAEADDGTVSVDKSSFSATLTTEEVNILALLMKQSWVERQVASIENTRMKYSGSDFKFTSQANHLQKLLSLLEEARRDSFHMQRLYGRRVKNDSGLYESNWKVLNTYNN